VVAGCRAGGSKHEPKKHEPKKHGPVAGEPMAGGCWPVGQWWASEKARAGGRRAGGRWPVAGGPVVVGCRASGGRLKARAQKARAGGRRANGWWLLAGGGRLKKHGPVAGEPVAGGRHDCRSKGRPEAQMLKNTMVWNTFGSEAPPGTKVPRMGPSARRLPAKRFFVERQEIP